MCRVPSVQVRSHDFLASYHSKLSLTDLPAIHRRFSDIWLFRFTFDICCKCKIFQALHPFCFPQCSLRTVHCLTIPFILFYESFFRAILLFPSLFSSSVRTTFNIQIFKMQQYVVKHHYVSIINSDKPIVRFIKTLWHFQS